MEPKVICVLLVVFSLALSTQAQDQAGKTAPFLLLGGHRELARWGLRFTVQIFEPSAAPGP